MISGGTLKTYDINFKLEIEGSVPVQAKTEQEAVQILKNKMTRIIEVRGRAVEEIDVDTKIILVSEEIYE
jgi:hypothetical protein